MFKLLPLLPFIIFIVSIIGYLNNTAKVKRGLPNATSVTVFGYTACISGTLVAVIMHVLSDQF